MIRRRIRSRQSVKAGNRYIRRARRFKHVEATSELWF